MVNYLNWRDFGQLPSQNFIFNRMVEVDKAHISPFFCCGNYSDYYCLITDDVINGNYPILNQEVENAKP